MNAAIATVPLVGDEINLSDKDIARFWSKVDKINGPIPDQNNTHYAGLDRCWDWTDHKHKRGYGCFRVGRKMVHAHRVAWVIAKGFIPRDADGKQFCVMHQCDRTSCCRPDHLRLGTHTDNMHDMAAKGRNRQPSGDANGSRLHPEKRPRGDGHYARLHPERLARGEANGSRLHPESRPRGASHANAKLTDALVIEIRRLHATKRFTYAMLGAQFGMSKAVICKIVLRQMWKHVSDEWI